MKRVEFTDEEILAMINFIVKHQNKPGSQASKPGTAFFSAHMKLNAAHSEVLRTKYKFEKLVAWAKEHCSKGKKG